MSYVIVLFSSCHQKYLLGAELFLVTFKDFQRTAHPLVEAKRMVAPQFYQRVECTFTWWHLSHTVDTFQKSLLDHGLGSLTGGILWEHSRCSRPSLLQVFHHLLVSFIFLGVFKLQLQPLYPSWHSALSCPRLFSHGTTTLPLHDHPAGKISSVF